MTDKQNFPSVPKDLLEELESRFPDRVPNIDANHHEVYGQVSVVRLLRRFFNEQNETILEKKT
jgi:hypothetical protein